MRNVFFSFDWDDVWRSNPVRNSWVIKGNKASGFKDSAEIEAAKKSSAVAIKNWIDNQLSNTSVTCVLIGSQTYNSRWVRYEINESMSRGNGLLGVYIHGIKDQNGFISAQGLNPLPNSLLYKTYDWFADNGYENLGDWIEEAARQVGR